MSSVWKWLLVAAMLIVGAERLCNALGICPLARPWG